MEITAAAEPSRSRPRSLTAGKRIASVLGAAEVIGLLKHDPVKWTPVFGKDHAQTTS
jgi:hypothetical protein